MINATIAATITATDAVTETAALTARVSKTVVVPPLLLLLLSSGTLEVVAVVTVDEVKLEVVWDVVVPLLTGVPPHEYAAKLEKLTLELEAPASFQAAIPAPTP